MEFNFTNVNYAFRDLVAGISSGEIPTLSQPSRAGDVIRISEPVTLRYDKPWERVLFNPLRDANPFFHVFEALWMLAGRNDVAPLLKFNSKIAEIASDYGEIFNGAYGYRWRSKGVDQLKLIIEHLKNDPESRRAVLQMWNVEDDLLKVEQSKDVCCNTAIYFSLRGECLDMTVTNRSNDLIWGCLGANYVHFTFLQEYLATRLGRSIGRYYHFSNNLHVYKNIWDPDLWLDAYKNRTSHDAPINYGDQHRILVPLSGSYFDEELPMFVEHLLCPEGLVEPLPGLGLTKQPYPWRNRFFGQVAYPMRMAWDAYKSKNRTAASDWCKAIMADDWRQACTTWLEKRLLGWVK